jgi:hypothetical protein
MDWVIAVAAVWLLPVSLFIVVATGCAVCRPFRRWVKFHLLGPEPESTDQVLAVRSIQAPADPAKYVNNRVLLALNCDEANEWAAKSAPAEPLREAA